MQRFAPSLQGFGNQGEKYFVRHFNGKAVHGESFFNVM